MLLRKNAFVMSDCLSPVWSYPSPVQESGVEGAKFKSVLQFFAVGENCVCYEMSDC